MYSSAKVTDRVIVGARLLIPSFGIFRKKLKNCKRLNAKTMQITRSCFLADETMNTSEN